MIKNKPPGRSNRIIYRLWLVILLLFLILESPDLISQVRQTAKTEASTAATGPSLLPELIIQTSHTENVSKMVFNALGDRLVSVASDQSVKIWDVRARKLMRTIDGFTENELVNVQFGAGDQTIITLEDNFIRYFDAASGKPLRTIQIDDELYGTHNCFVLKAIEELNLLVVSWSDYEDHFVEFRELETGKLIRKVGDHASHIISAEYNPITRSVIYADYSHLYDYSPVEDEVERVYSYKKTKDAVANMQIQGGHVWLFSSDGFLTTLSAKNFKQLVQRKIIDYKDYFYLNSHPFLVTNRGEVIYFSSNEDYEYKLHRLDPEEEGATKLQFGEVAEIEERISGMAFEKHNRWVAINQSENIIILSIDNMEPLFRYRNITNWFKNVEPLMMRGQFLAVPFYNSNIYHWNLVEGTVVLQNLPGDANDISVNPVDLEFALSDGYQNYMISLPEFAITDSNMITEEVEYFGGAFNNAYILPPGEYNIIFGNEGKKFVTQYGKRCGIKLWDRKTGALLKKIEIDDESQVIEHMDYRSDLGLVLVETSNNGFGNYKTVLVDIEREKIASEWSGNIRSCFFPRSPKAFIPGGIVSLETGELESVPGYEQSNWSDMNPDVSRREKYLAYTDGDSLVIVDLLKNTHTTAGFHKDMEGVRFMSNESKLITFGRDGVLKMWDSEEKNLVATFIAETRNSWEPNNSPVSYLIVTPDGYFMGPKKLYDLVAYNLQNQVYSFDQFDEIFNRPDIVLDRLGFAPKRLVESYKLAYEKRKKNRVGESSYSMDQLPAVKVKILNKQSIPAKTNLKNFSFTFTAGDPTVPVKGYNIWVNGVSKYDTRFKEFAGFAKESTITEEIELVSGRNYIEIAAINSLNMISLKEIIEIDYTGLTKKDLYMIGIGMSNYMDTSYNLTYPEKDVNDFMGFQSTSSYFTSIFSLQLMDSDFTLNSYGRMENFLKDAGPDDQVVLFYAGHGLLGNNQEYFLATWDIDFYDPDEKGFPFDTLVYLFSHVTSHERVMLIDACHSGLLDMDAGSAENVPGGENNIRIANRGGWQSNPSNYMNDPFEMMQAMFVNLNKGTGTTIISAAGGTQFAYESEKVNNGLFTYAYLDGIKTGKADQDGDGNITITEIKNYLEIKVLQLSNGYQKPALRQMNYYNDFTVWSAKDTELNQFFRAVSSDNIQAVQEFLDRGTDVNAVDPSNQFTALHYAAREGRDNALRLLVSNGAKMNQVTSFGWTPLYLAVNNSNLSTALLLLQAGADKEIVGINGLSLESVAQTKGNKELFDILTNTDKVLKELDLHQPLFSAIANGDTAILTGLLDNSEIDPDYLHPGYSLGFLHAAAFNGRTEVARMLINNGTDLNLQSNSGITALIIAAFRGNNDLLSLLLEEGANSGLTDSEGKSAYDYANAEGKEILENWTKSITR